MPALPRPEPARFKSVLAGHRFKFWKTQVGLAGVCECGMEFKPDPKYRQHTQVKVMMQAYEKHFRTMRRVRRLARMVAGAS